MTNSSGQPVSVRTSDPPANILRHLFARLGSTGFVVLMLVLLTAGFAIATHGQLLSFRSLNLILTFAPEIILITIGIGILLIVGEFDLSIGSIYVFSSVALAALVRDVGVPLPAAVVCGILLGGLLGTINGVLVVTTGVTSFIITLGAMWAYKGIMLLLVGGGSIQAYPPTGQEWVFSVLTGKVLTIPLQTLWLFVIAALLALLLNRSRFGNWLRAIGSNARAARMMGVPVGRIKIAAFALCGLLCGFAGVVQVSHSNHAIPQSGDFVMLTALAGAIVGGISLKGGSGGISGPFLGAMILQVISLGFIMLGVVEYWTNVMTAVAVVGTAVLYTRMGKSRGKQP